MSETHTETMLQNQDDRSTADTTPTAPAEVPREVWIVLDKDGDPHATSMRKPPLDITETWREFVPSCGPYRVVRYVHEDAVAAAVERELEMLAEHFSRFSYGSYANPAVHIRVQIAIRNRAKEQSNG